METSMETVVETGMNAAVETSEEARYRVIFSGKIRDGLDLGTVRAMVAERLRGASPAQVNRIFSGKRIILKGGLTEAAAHKYIGKLERLGMVMSLVKERVPAIVRLAEGGAGMHLGVIKSASQPVCSAASSALANTPAMPIVSGAPAETASASDEDSWMTSSSFADLARTQVNLDRAEALLNGSGYTGTESNSGEAEPVVWPVLAQPEPVAQGLAPTSELVLLEATPVTIVGGHGADHAHSFVFRGEFVCNHCGVAHPVTANVHVQAVSQSASH